MDHAHRTRARRMRALLAQGQAPPETFRAALLSVPSPERDAWLDLVCGLDELPEDSPQLPRGCTPYLPCPVDALLRMFEHTRLQPSDVFVDVGSGLGRAAALAQLMTGATSIGIEIQPDLVRASRALARRLNLTGFSVLEGDAAQPGEWLSVGSVFFLYCPFSQTRLDQFLDRLAPIAQTRPIRVCSVQLPLPARPWLTPLCLPDADLEVCRSRPPS